MEVYADTRELLQNCRSLSVRNKSRCAAKCNGNEKWIRICWLILKASGTVDI
jgi:hypothetical protein